MKRREIFRQLTSALESSDVQKWSALPWACPVPYFGSLDTAKLATVGLNPSNREFVNAMGEELTENSRRFPTLTSLGLQRWSDASGEQFDAIAHACSKYFFGNPYDGWFRALDKIIIGSDCSFYGMFSEACHLDLCPYATSTKWGELSGTARQALLNVGGDFLGNLIANSDIRILVLNGQAVIRTFESLCEVKLQALRMDEWTLPRSRGDGVSGFSYFGKLSKIGNRKLNREILVLGYSHNIQSSFGVTSKVRESIGSWISATTKREMISIT
ncbi:hypothetical protein [Lacisediminimonas profundi]|uniref:hypothetical protein n=1 Tax=Lacisediminimonas profundi TaxID=2603856 RepID=UPI0019D63D7D|nr:hypothetical protein [Lacisediminimonas profundi]